ncbi:hypothetical protein [Viridibacillus arvi]
MAISYGNFKDSATTFENEGDAFENIVTSVDQVNAQMAETLHRAVLKFKI